MRFAAPRKNKNKQFGQNRFDEKCDTSYSSMELRFSVGAPRKYFFLPSSALSSLATYQGKSSGAQDSKL